MDLLECPSCENGVSSNATLCPACGYVRPHSIYELPWKTKNIAALLAIFLGTFGVHKYYLGKSKSGLLYVLFFWTAIPTIIGLIEGIIYSLQSDETFAQRQTGASKNISNESTYF